MERRGRVLVVHPEPTTRLLESLLTTSSEVVLLVPSRPGAAPVVPRALADRVAVHTYIDYDDAVSLALKLHTVAPVDAAFAVWEGAVETAAAISEALDLPGYSPAATRAARDKAVAAECFVRAGVSHPRTWTFDATTVGIGANLLQECPDGQFVVKMPRSTNSQSVMLVRSRSDLDEALAVIRRLYRADRDSNRLADLYQPVDGTSNEAEPVLAQEYVSGQELNIDLLLSEDGHAVLGVFEKHPAVGPTFGEMHSVHPTSLSSAEVGQAVEVAVAASRALGATRGAAHAELRMSEHGPVVIEVALRPGGFLTPLAIQRLTGIDIFAALARLMVTGTLPHFPAMSAQSACLYGAVNVERSGRVIRISGQEQARSLPGVVLLDVIKKPGDTLVTLPEGTDYHIAAFLVEGGSRTEVESVAEQIRGCLTAELEETTR